MGLECFAVGPLLSCVSDSKESSFLRIALLTFFPGAMDAKFHVALVFRFLVQKRTIPMIEVFFHPLVESGSEV